MFMRVLQAEDVKESNEFVIQCLADATMMLLFQGKEISSFKGENFARTIWSIWVG